MNFPALLFTLAKGQSRYEVWHYPESAGTSVHFRPVYFPQYWTLSKRSGREAPVFFANSWMELARELDLRGIR